jgi:cell division protein FtsB
LRTEYALRRPVANAYLVRERDRRRLRELGLVLLAVLPLAAALLAYTWIRLEIVRTGYRIDTMERQLENLMQVERRLRLDAAELSRPQLIEERARRELGMTSPNLDQMIFVQGGDR